MTKENAKKLIPIVQAIAEGKTIQRKDGRGNWYDYESSGPPADELRIKPEPREFWVNEYASLSPHGVLHNSKEEAELAAKTRGQWDNHLRTIHVREVI